MNALLEKLRKRVAAAEAKMVAWEEADRRRLLKAMRRQKPKKARSEKAVARERFMRSPEWAAARVECFERLGRACSACGSLDEIQVDHIKPRSKFPELALEQGNLRPLCWPCNKAKAAKVLP